MYYSININQIAIAKYNKAKESNKLDLIDGCIMEYLQKQTTSNFAKKNFIIINSEVFYLLCYENIIQQLPLINIETKDAIGRRIKKLKEENIINHFIDRKNGNKIYFNTTDLFETFFSYDLTDEKPKPSVLKTERLTDEKPNHNIYNDNSINDNSINDKVKHKKLTLEENLNNDLRFSEEDKEEIKVFLQDRKERKKPITERGLNILLNELKDLVDRGYKIKYCVDRAIQSNWTGIKSEWFRENNNMNKNIKQTISYNFDCKDDLNSIIENDYE